MSHVIEGFLVIELVDNLGGYAIHFYEIKISNNHPYTYYLELAKTLTRELSNYGYQIKTISLESHNPSFNAVYRIK
jgi:hypothetical protein